MECADASIDKVAESMVDLGCRRLEQIDAARSRQRMYTPISLERFSLRMNLGPNGTCWCDLFGTHRATCLRNP